MQEQDSRQVYSVQERTVLVDGQCQNGSLLCGNLERTHACVVKCGACLETGVQGLQDEVFWLFRSAVARQRQSRPRLPVFIHRPVRSANYNATSCCDPSRTLVPVFCS